MLKKNEEQYHDLRGKLRTFSREVSVIGARHLMNDSSTQMRKFIWIAFILFGVGLSIYQIRDRILYYRMYPTSSDIKITQANKLRFPQVTFCNENLLKKSSVNELGKYE